MADTQDPGTRPHRRRAFVRPQDRHDCEQDGYDVKYDNDGRGEELGENARVWRMFRDEGSAHDTRAFQGLRDHLDVDLVFSGLFAAVVTTCLTQSSQALQPDHAEIGAALLSELIAVQRAIASGTPVSEIPPSALQPKDVTASSLDFWTNRFWYFSLLLGLFAAFLAFIVRGWLHAYDNEVFGSPKHRALTQHYRRMGLDRWHVGLIVLILPTLLHASMLLFFVGLTLNLRIFDVPMAKLVIALTGTFYALYFMSVCLPVFFPQCPYRSPLSEWAYRVKAAHDWLRALLRGEEGRALPRTWRELEEREVAAHADYIISRGLDLALQESSDLSIDSLVIQAVSSLPYYSRRDKRADKYYGKLLRGRVLAWFFTTLRNRGFVFDWAPGRERVLQRIACALLLVPEDRVRSSSADNLQYTRCATRILQALVHAISSADVADSDMMILIAISIALESRLDQNERQSILELISSEALKARIVNAYTTLAQSDHQGGLRLQPVVWEGMLISFENRCSGAYVPEPLALLLWHSFSYREDLSLVDEDRQGFPAISTVTLRRWLDSTPERRLLAQDVIHSSLCPSPSCQWQPAAVRGERGDAESDAADATSSLHTVCRAIEVHRITMGTAIGDSDFLSTQAIEPLLVSLYHGSLGNTWRIVEGSGVSLPFFSKFVSRCRPSTLELLKPKDAPSSSTLAGEQFWFLAQLLSALDDDANDPFGSSGPASASSSSSSSVPSLPASSIPSLPASPAASSSSALPRATDPAKLDIVRAMEHQAAAYFPTAAAAGVPDELDPLPLVRPVVMAILTDPRLALLCAPPRVIAWTVAARLRGLAGDAGHAKETRRMDLSWCVFLDVLVAARATRDGVEARATRDGVQAAKALHDALISLRPTHGRVWTRRVLSAFESPIPPALGIALASPRGCEALAQLMDTMPSSPDYPSISDNRPVIGDGLETLRILKTLRVWLDEEWYQTCVSHPEEPCRSDTVPIWKLVNFEQYSERLHDGQCAAVAHNDVERASRVWGRSEAEAGDDCGQGGSNKVEGSNVVEEDEEKRADARIIPFEAVRWARLRGILLIFLRSERRRGEHIDLQDSSDDMKAV
ncbi:uncharacterized protein SCHCODRAFT_02644168 [Schizophyllum commune H4-8]|uniref:uncharacterized protein n=1 Tax=Schizophyllum commune (strain H4-8 / FGSC 9210) TaxID=578458 RepID=UPI00215E1AAC|nr:uncharacterized protein SCHCODRAFT_02644168 [Schizophyllum commune H4-8]KAI5885711.1 hypothetical protein SCHCODRAFT_02644168 [Schizophyllum commune H4-8]